MHNDDLWFATSRVQVRLSNRVNDGKMSILEHSMAHNFSPPLHVHRHEDETFYVLEGSILFKADGKVTIVAAGGAVHVPAGKEHTFLVVSPNGARMLTITHGGFEDMVRESSRPAASNGLPEQSAPTPAQQAAMFEAGKRNGIELLGAPLTA